LQRQALDCGTMGHESTRNNASDKKKVKDERSMCQWDTRNTENVNMRGCDETKKKHGAGGGTPLPLARGRKIDDKVKNKIYFKRTQLLRGFPGRKNVCLGKCARVDS